MAGVKGYESLELIVGPGGAGSTINLLGSPGIGQSACGFSLLEAGGGRKWGGNGEIVADVFQLRCSGSNITEQENTLKHMLDLARQQARGVGQSPVYLRARTAHESEKMQTVVTGGDLQEVEPIFSYLPAKHGLDRFALMVEHLPAWERVTTGASGVAIVGVTPTATPTNLFSVATYKVEGDLSARLAQFLIERNTSSSDVKEVWCGWRTSQYNEDYDAATCFWDLKDAHSYGANTSDGSSASATSGCCAIWTPAGGADDSILTRAKISAVSAFGSTDAPKTRGEYQLLLRARSTGSRTFYVRVSPGNVVSNVYSSGTRFEVSGSFFKLYSIGSVQIPPDDSLSRFNQYILAWHTGFLVEAGVATAGTGNLEMDGFYLIPTGEGFCYAKTGTDAVMSGSTAGFIGLYSDDTGQEYALLKKEVSGGTNEYSSLEMQPDKWAVPLGLRKGQDTALVLVYQDTDRHRLADSVDLTITWVGRYSRLG